jgi:hypothetical protein
LQNVGFLAGEGFTGNLPIGDRFHLIVSESDGDTQVTNGEIMNFTGIAPFEGFGLITVSLDAGGEVPSDMRLCADCRNRDQSREK